MINRALKTTIRLALLFGLLTGFSGAGAAELEFSDPWIRLPPPGSRTAAGYLLIRNAGSTAVELTGARSDDFGRIMLHSTTIDDQGISRMRHLEVVRIEPGDSFRFQPNGAHLMLFEPVRPLREGAVITLELETSDDQTVPVDLPVHRELPAGH